MAELAPLLAEIEALTVAIDTAAGAGDWTTVQALDEARYVALANLPQHAFDTADPTLKGVLEQALAVTRSVLEQARTAQAREAGALREVQRGHRGALAYLEACR